MLLNLLDSGEVTLVAGENPVKAAQYPCKFIVIWPSSGTHAMQAGLSGTGKQGIYIRPYTEIADYAPLPIYTDDANKIVVTGTVGEKLSYAIYG